MFSKPVYSIYADHDLKIIRYKHTGLIKKEDLDKVWIELIEMKEFTQMKYNLLSDYRKSRFDIPLANIETIINAMKPMVSILKGKKQSFIIDDPLSMATTMLFVNKANELTGLKNNIFSTEKAAIHWLTL